MKRLETAAIILSLLVVGCEPHDPGPSFTQDVAPILKRNCVMCHMEGGALGELSLHPQPHAALVGAASVQTDLVLVAPCDVEASYLYHKMLGSHLDVGGEGESMPFPDLLAEEDITVIEQWIARGAREN